ncbi:creatininase family protein [Candidatus Bathyarchaeota archaeon]|nr:creatininase family protein [Candidatus Bathyarchaeota archaeon]
MENMTWKDFEEKLRNTKTVLIPFGSTEEHGYHLPLSTDYHVAYEIAKRVSEKTSVLVTPPICYGVCRRGESFPGTITISFDTLRSLTLDIVESLYSHNLRNIVLLPGHLGSAQLTSLEIACQESLRKHSDLNLVIIRLPEILKKLPAGIIDEQFGHAGEVETSIMLALLPQLVEMKKAVSEIPSFPPHHLTRDARDFMRSGIIGDATNATLQKGEAILELLISEISKVIGLFENKSLK